MKTPFIAVVLTGLLMLITSAFRTPVTSVYRYDYENVLGTSLQLKVAAHSEQTADYAEQLALEEIDRLTNILSTYDPSSEINRWLNSRDIAIQVSPEIFEVFTLFDEWKLKTSGVLTASISTASNVWKNAEVHQKIPTPEELILAVESMKHAQWKLNRELQTATHFTNESLALNSFVKSYIIHKVSNKIMSVPGVVGADTNIGGDIVIAGNQTEVVTIANPTADAENDRPVSIVSLQGLAIATSGDYRRGFQIGDHWYSHIIDPRTCLPVSQIISATVVSKNATDAGALATVFNILSPEESEALAETIPGVEFLIITKDGREIVSKGWNAMEVSSESNATPITTENYQQRKLTIALELGRFEGRFRRPFVAVWIENKKKESVRTIALWYNKPRWLPDLKRWYSKNQSMMTSMSTMQSISSATRSPGEYTLNWDGLDANGKAVPSGTYTIYIEAAREHGTYQLIKQEIDWTGKPLHVDLKGGVEITAASLDITL